MSERSEQIRVFDVLRLNEQFDPRLKWIYASMNGLNSKSPRMAADRKRQGQKAGIADICVPFPSFPGFGINHGAYIEMKSGKNRPTAQQKEFLAFVLEQGYSATVAYSADEALDFIERYCNLKLRGRK